MGVYGGPYGQRPGIAKLPATFSAINGLSQVYDGTPRVVTATISPSGLEGVAVSYDGRETPPTDAGSYLVVATLASPSHAAPLMKDRLVVDKATASLGLAAYTQLTFDGLPHPAPVSTTPPGLAGVTALYNGSTTVPVQTGIYSVVAWLVNPNYSATAVMGTLDIINPAPSIGTIAPLSRLAGSAAFTLTVTGTSFVDGAAVIWNGGTRTTAFDSSTQVRATIPSADLTAAGLVAIQVRNPAPAVGDSASAVFAVYAEPLAFADDPLVPHVTPILATHIEALRDAVATLRARHGLTPASWTDTPLVPRATPVRAVHLTELRVVLNEVYRAVGRPAPLYAVPSFVTGSTPVAAAHVAELRAAILAVW